MKQGLTDTVCTESSLSRRQFLCSAGLVAGSAITGSLVAQDASPPELGFVDAHSHIWTLDIDAYPLAAGRTLADLDPPTFTPEELLETVRPHGVTRVVLIQHRPYHGVDNSYLTDTMSRFPGVFSAVGCVNERSPQLTKELERLRGLGVRGFRIRPGEGGTARWQDSEGIREMWRYASEHQAAICPLINPENLAEVDEMSRQFPDATVVVDHFARVGIDGTIRESDLNNLIRLARHEHVHIKVSAFYALGRKQPPHDELIPMIRRLFEAFGPRRLMWGSDCPYQIQGANSYGASIALIRDTIDFLSASDREWLLARTAEKIYFS